MKCYTKIVAAIYLIIIFSCRQKSQSSNSTQSAQQPTIEAKNVIEKEKDSVIVNGNTTINFSTDVSKLSKLLYFERYRPYKVKYKHTFIDNSRKGERVATPGPSDYYLQAVLYFDSTTISKMADDLLYSDTYTPEHKDKLFNKELFKFDWLDKDIIQEIENSEKNHQGNYDVEFSKTTAISIFPRNKILIQTWTD